MVLKSEYSRIKSVLFKDKSNRSENFNTVLKSEIYELLSNYMELKGVECFFNLQENGDWQIKILANTSNFYSIKTGV